MLGQVGINSFGWKYTNNANPSGGGTAITPGASNAEGSWTQVASSANIANDVYGVWLWINSGNTSGQAKNHLLDLGTDPAGGTSYTAIVSNIQCGQAHNAVFGGFFYYLPIKIKAGSSVAVRIQGSNATAGTVRVNATFYGAPSNPHLVRAGTYSETVGTITDSNGVSFTPGNSNAEGSWVSLGTTTRSCWYWIPSVQINNATTTSLMYYIDFAYGDASNKVMIVENLPILLSGTAEQTTQPMWSPVEYWKDVPAGSTLYVRGSCSSTAISGFTALMTGIGG
jgi:hypothetical protein